MRQLVVLLLVAASGCTVADRYQEVQSSIPYDAVDCAELVRQRNALAAAHGIPRDYRRETRRGDGTSLLPDLDAVTPDMRGQAARDRDRAIASVSAMNGSIVRRACEQPR